MAAGKLLMFPGVEIVDLRHRVGRGNFEIEPDETVKRFPARKARGTKMCRECGEQISPDRLNIMPKAIRCTWCQRDQEADGWKPTT